MSLTPFSKTLFLGNDGRLQWETLVTGIFALVAAFGTIFYLRKQIWQTQQLADDRRRRRERAALATLPLVLSELSEYAISCIKGLCCARPYYKIGASIDILDRQEKLSNWTLPHISDNTLLSLKECIEFADDAPACAMISLIRHLQIQRARLEDYISRASGNDPGRLLLLSNIESAICDAAEVHGRASALFPFARGGQASAFTHKDICRALSLSGCFNDDKDISDLVNKWQQRRSVP